MNYDVLMVGFGPVGATMANLLTRAGLRIAVVEAELGVYDKPRALTFDHEAMRIFQACGLAHRIAPFTDVHRGTHYVGMDGQVIKKFVPMPPPFPLSWPPTITFVQPELERVLREGVAESNTAHVLLGHRALAFSQDEHGVALRIRDGAREEERVIEGRWLVACDGANSFVRKQLDIPVEDLGFDEWWMVVDVLLKEPVELPPQSVQYCWPARPSTFVPGPRNLRRWEIKLLPGEDPEAFGHHDNVVKQIGRFVDTSRVKIWRSAVYRFHALLAQRWRDRRIFLMGDACHQTPPFLGQGMCAGIRDASNLAWKLAMVIQHGAPDPLLDTYEQERKPHVRKLVATAKEFGLIIGELDPEAARIRDEQLRGQLERGEAETIRQRFVPNLSDGVIDGDPQARAPGSLFVQPRVRHRAASGDCVLLDDVLQSRFLIATSSAQAQAWLTAESVALWRQMQGEQIVIGAPEQSDDRVSATDRDFQVFVETESLFADWMAQHACCAVVVRPDRYVFGVASDPTQLNRLVSEVGRMVKGEG